MKVARIADAFGCKVLLHCRHPKKADYPILDLDELCAQSDILSIHTPLNEDSFHLINESKIAIMKDGVLIVNVARGAVTDEAAIAKGILSGKIGGFATDVYSEEPFTKNHPFYSLREHPNVCMTPHMAWHEQCIIWGNGATRLSAKGFIEEIERIENQIREIIN